MSLPFSDLPAAFERLSVLVVGDAMLDTYLEGSSGRLCSEAPVPVVDIGRRVHVAGGAANVAVNLRSLGATPHLLAVTGTDTPAERLRRALATAGVDGGEMLVSRHRSTLAKERVMADGQILVRFDHGTTEALDRETESALLERLSRAHAAVDAILVSDYGYGVLTPRVIAHLAALQRRDPRLLLVDSKSLPAYRGARVTAAKPNYAQAARLLGLAAGDGGPLDRAAAMAAHAGELLDQTGARLVAVTLDAEGALVVERRGAQHRIPARPVRPVRSVGAGDTFGAAMTLALAAGAGVPEAADLAAAAAAVVVSKEGTAVCSAAELRQQLPAGGKLAPDRQRLAKALDSLHRQGRRIVFTNGCFDLLHRGHVACLRRARALGDVLVVGVNSDAGVCRLKGPGRPINPLPDRVEVLAALDCVDHVVAFDEDTPENLIRLVRPHTFVKGGDYRLSDLPEAGLVEALGGKVEILPYVEERSTTGLIARILERASPGAAA